MVEYSPSSGIWSPVGLLTQTSATLYRIASLNLYVDTTPAYVNSP